MRIAVAMSFCSLVVCASGIAQRQRLEEPFPTEVVIGRDSFIDVGPPFNYYDLTFLRSNAEKTEVERISLTPPADACYPKAEIAVAHVSLNESLASVLQKANPCTIPEKALKAELKRRNRGLPVFSGMNVSIQVECTRGVRVIHADILDRDIFDLHPNTPQYTAWSRSLFDKLDEATGDHPWEKPIFPALQSDPSTSPTLQSAALQEIADGKFDSIFENPPDRFSALYRTAQNPPRQPLIELVNSEPVRPTEYIEPVFPPIAKAARVHGIVEFHLTVAGDGLTESIAIDSGPKLLWQATSDAISKWRFTLDDSGKVVRGSIRFGLNCANDSK